MKTLQERVADQIERQDVTLAATLRYDPAYGRDLSDLEWGYVFEEARRIAEKQSNDPAHQIKQVLIGVAFMFGLLFFALIIKLGSVELAKEFFPSLR